jgi:hypothetical protein
MYYGSAAGLYPRTAGVNDLGNPVRDAVADGGELYCQALQQMVVLTQRGLLSSNSFMNLNQSLFMMLVM